MPKISTNPNNILNNSKLDTDNSLNNKEKVEKSEKNDNIITNNSTSIVDCKISKKRTSPDGVNAVKTNTNNKNNEKDNEVELKDVKVNKKNNVLNNIQQNTGEEEKKVQENDLRIHNNVFEYTGMDNLPVTRSHLEFQIYCLQGRAATLRRLMDSLERCPRDNDLANGDENTANDQTERAEFLATSLQETENEIKKLQLAMSRRNSI